MTDLVVCVTCERHFRPTEARCPFCDAAALATTPARPQPRAPRGLSRAKLYALHSAALAAGVAVSVACGGDTSTKTDASTDGNGGDGTTKDATSDGTSNDDANADATAEAGNDTGSSDAARDVVEDDGWGPPPPPYGCVFPGGCSSVIV